MKIQKACKVWNPERIQERKRIRKGSRKKENLERMPEGSRIRNDERKNEI